MLRNKVRAMTRSPKIPRSMQLRLNQQLTGKRSREARSSQIDNNNQLLLNDSFPTGSEAGTTDNGSFITSDIPNEYIENADPLRRRIISRGRRLWIVRKLIAPLIEWWQEKHRPLTTEEIYQKELEAKQREVEKIRQKDAEQGGKQIEETLTRLGFCDVRLIEGSRRVLDTFRLGHVLIYDDRIIYKVTHYPWGENNKAMNFLSEPILNEIARSVGHKVYGHDDPDTGALFIVELASTAGIPDMVTFSEMMKTRPASASDLTIPIGIAPGGRTIWRDIDDAPHWLVGGSTGMGKSNIENAWLCSLLSSGVKPDRLRMLMIDAKRTELTLYKGIPHLLVDKENKIVDGIARTPEEALRFVRYVRRECERRMTLFEGKYNDIREYNKRHPKKGKLPHLLLWIDELGLIALVPGLGKEFNEELIGLTNIGRAMGIYVLIFTQKPQANVIDTRITINTDGRLAFGCPTGPASQILVNNWDAVGLPIGRAVLNMRESRFIVQTPMISQSIRQSIIADLKAGREVSQDYHSVLEPEELVKWASDYNSGSLRRDDLYRKFVEHEQRIAKGDLQELLLAMDGKIFEADGKYYRVLPPRAQFERKLQLCEAPETLKTLPVAPDPDSVSRATGDASGGDAAAWEIEPKNE